MADPRFFKPPTPVALADIAAITGATLQLAPGHDASRLVHDVGPIHTADADKLSFLDNKKYADMFAASRAGVCLVTPDMVQYAPAGMDLLVTPMPYKAYALAAQKFYPEPGWTKTFIAPSAYIHPSARIGANCIIDHNVYIGQNVTIGANCWLKPNVVVGHGVEIGGNTVVGSNSSLSYCILGDNIRVLPGVRIGQDGFGFASDVGGHTPVPQLGRVIVGNGVWIGANTTIDRGAGPDTVIGDGVMIDNLVQIGHNVKIGRFAVIVAQVGISGSTEIEDYVVLAGQVGVAGHLNIGRGARIGAQSGVTQNVEAGAEVVGTPPVPVRQYFRQVATLANLVKSKS